MARSAGGELLGKDEGETSISPLLLPLDLHSPFARCTQSDHDEVSPLSPHETRDISRLSGFPQISEFNFEFNSDSVPEPMSPTAYDRRPSEGSRLSLMPHAAPPFVTQLPTPLSPLPSFASNLVCYHPPEASTGTIVDEEAPPPYTRFAQQGESPLDPQYPAHPNPAYTPDSRRGNRYFTSASEIRSSQRMNVLTLDDMRSAGGLEMRRQEAEINRQKHERRQRREGRWRGWWFCPEGACLGLRMGSARTEKGKMTKTRKWCLIGSLVFIILVAAIVGGVLGARSRPRKTVTLEPDGRPPLPDEILPLGTMVVRPFRAAQLLTTCVGRPYQWSCLLPPDTKFPVTNATSDNFRVPEFRFTIKRRGSFTKSQAMWTPLPRNVPNTTDYEALSSVDGVKDAGELSDFYISLTTGTNPSEFQDDDGDGTNAIRWPNVRSLAKRADIREESHMLPSAIMNQPLRLFDRGLDTEHYGFHIYFRKTVQFSNDSRLESSKDTGGVAAKDSGFRIQWNNTRFKVTIATRPTTKIVEAGEGTGMDLPVDIWEDRAGGDPRGRYVAAWTLSDTGVPLQQRMILEKKGVNTEKRGCFCHWSNYRQSSP